MTSARTPTGKERQLLGSSRAERAASTGAPSWDPVQGLRAGAPSPVLPPLRTGVRPPSSSSGGREAARRAREQTKSSRNPFPRQVFTAADLREDCWPGHHTGEPSGQSVAHTRQLRRGMGAHPGGRRGSRQVWPLGSPARPAPSGCSAPRTEEGTPRTRGSRAQAGRSP